MTKPTINDRETGGYYALKGFAYQIDTAILQILRTDSDKQINIERIQDIDSDDFVMQVKYKETQNYSPAKIREPLLQLLEEFHGDRNKKYILFCHFKDQKEQYKTINLDELNSILTPINGKSKKSVDINNRIEKIPEGIKKEFIHNFKIAFSPAFQESFERVIGEVANLYKGIPHEEAVLYYSWICSYIQNKITLEPGGQSFSKSEILACLKDAKSMIFESAYKDYCGQVSYVSFVQKKFIRPNKKRYNLIFINAIEIASSVSISQLVQNIVDHHYIKATYDVRPLTFIVDDQYTHTIKKQLSQANYLFNDGYESIYFNPLIFNEEPVINKKTRGPKKIATDTLEKSSFLLRIISRSTYEKIQEKTTPDMTYSLGPTRNRDIQTPFLLLEGLNSKELSTLFCR